MKAPQRYVTRTYMMMLGQEQIRQLRFLTFRAAACVVGGRRRLQFANDAIRSKRREKFDLIISRCSGLPVSEIYDFALLPAFDGRMRLIHKTLKPLRKPMVASKPACAPRSFPAEQRSSGHRQQ